MFNDRAGPSFPPRTLDRWHNASVPVSAAALLGRTRTLGVIVPHADDETLGCGGLIAAAADRGIHVIVTVLTDGSASHPGSAEWPPARLARRRQREVRAAVAALTNGRGTLAFADAPDGQLADHPAAALAVPPADLFVTCWRDDPHPDHAAAFAIADAVARRHTRPLLAFPLWALDVDGPVPDMPIHRLDVSAQLPRKHAALAAHASQLGALIRDVDGFVIDEALQRLFVRPDELFVQLR